VDSCRQQIWCRATSSYQKALDAASKLLAKADIDSIMEGSLRELARQAGPNAVRLVVYQVIRDGLSGTMGDFLAARLEGLAAGRKVFRIVPKEGLDKLLVAEKSEFGQLGRGSAGLQRKAEALMDAALAGTFSDDGQMIRLDLVLFDARGNRLAWASSGFFHAALPADVREAVRREREAVENQARLEQRKEEEERQRWIEEEMARREEKVRREIAAAEKSRLEKEARKQLGDELDQRIQIEVSRRLDQFIKGVLDAEKLSAEERARRIASQRARLEKEVRSDLARNQTLLVEDKVAHSINQAVHHKMEEEYHKWLDGKAKNSPLVVRSYLDRGCGATYHLGDEPIVFVKCNRDCYVKVFHTSVKGELQMVFPNKWDRNNFLEADRVHSIGDPTYRFQFRIARPLGLEKVTVVASEKQFSDMATVTRELEAQGLADYGTPTGGDYSDLATRGWVTEQRTQEIPAGASISRIDCPLRVAE